MTRSKRLYRIAEHVGQDQEAAARELSRLRAQLQEHEDQLERLRDYCLGYHQQLAEAQERGGSAARLANYSQFLARLNDAIRQQEQNVAAAGRAFEQQRQVWIDARARVKAVEKAAERCAMEETRIEDQREQRLSDDMNLTRLIRKS
ncbi:MAG: flagellar export protein FliJ [Wenzhouxiangella sp.]|nr:flagellar export protein FliJ [Wenzhouxiangella sp.]